MVKKLFAIILTICMVITMLPQIAFMAVQYPQEVTVFDSAKSGFNALSNEYGAFSISGDGKHTKNGDGSLTLGTNEGVQFTPNDLFKNMTKNGATLKISVSVKINESNADKGDKSIISLRTGSNTKALNLFEYNSKKEGEKPQFRGFSWNYNPKLVLERDNVAGTEITVDASINTKTQFGRVSFSGTDGKGNKISEDSNDYNFSEVTTSENVSYSDLKNQGVSLIRCYMNSTDVIKGFKIMVTDLSTDSLYASINTAESADDVEKVFDYYLTNGTFSYGDRFDELSDGEKSEIYGNFINKNFASDSEIQALFDKLVAKKFSIVTKTYTYDFEDGVNIITDQKGEIKDVDGSKVFAPKSDLDAHQINIDGGKIISDGPVVVYYDYQPNFISGNEGTYFRLLNKNDKTYSSYMLNKLTQYTNIEFDGRKASSTKLSSGTWYTMKNTFDAETLNHKLFFKEKAASDFTPVSYTDTDNTQKYIYTYPEYKGKIYGLDFRTRSNDYIDNIKVEIYNPVYTALYYTETADEVKNVFDTYKSIGALDVEDKLGEEVYSQFIGSSYTSTASLEAAIKVAAQFAALGRDAYVYDTYVKSGDTALDSEFEAGAITYGAKAYTDTAGTVVTLVIAQYKDKELTNLTYAEKTLVQGINDISDSLTVSESAGTTLKVFAVDKNANPYVVHKLLTGK